MATINPYLIFPGNTEEAFNFYKSVFRSDFKAFQRFKDVPSEQKLSVEDLEKVMHVSLPISEGCILMGTDTLESRGHIYQAGNNVSLAIEAKSEKEADALFKALSEGGVITLPMEKSFWGAYFGMLDDKFGIHWMINFDYNTND